jgi:hypothetical protein
MRSMERNKQTIHYSLYQDKIPILDDEGNESGEYKTAYSNPVEFRIRVSPNKGDSSEEVFGKSLDYDRVMNTADKRFSIDEFSILWIDTVPEIKEDGSTDTQHDFTVVRVAKDLNEWLFAIKKVT